MKKVHVISDGTREGTKIKNAITGEQITNCTSIGLFVTPDTDMEPRAHMVMLAPTIDMIAEVEQLEAEWIDLRRGGERPAPGSIVWVAVSGAVGLARYISGSFYIGEKLGGVTHWQYANLPVHPIHPDAGVLLLEIDENAAQAEDTHNE